MNKIRFYQISILVFFVFLWEIVARLNMIDTFIMSSPSRILTVIQNNDLLFHISVTFRSTIIGFLLGTSLGLFIAALLWWSTFLSKVLAPYLVILNALPKIALGPVIIIWVGANQNAIIVMALAISLVVTILEMLNGFVNTDTELIKMLKTFGASKLQIFFKVVMPYNINTLFSSLKINIGLSLVGVIAGEFLVSRAGLGYLIIYGGQIFQMDLVMASVVILGLLAALLYLLVTLIEFIVVNRGKFMKYISLLFLFFLVACGTSTENERTIITVSEVTRSVFYAPQYVAMELGFFYEEGLDIQLITSDGADRVMTALLSGSAQIGLSGPEATIYVYSQGREDFAIVFAGLTARDGSFLLGRQDDFIWDDLKGSYILPGRRGGMPFMVLEYVLTNKGLREYVYFNSTVQFAAMVSTFLGGTGDFVTAFEPIASTLELEGRGYVLKSVGEYAGELPYTTYYALSSFIEENTEIIEAFTRAVARGQRWVYENEAEDIADVISPFFPETDSEILASAIGRYKQIEAFALTPIITEEAFYRMQRIMDNAGELPQWIDFETLVNNDFSRKIIEN